MSTRTTYPTVYWTHGFGGTLAAIARGAEQRAKLMASKDLPEMIWVFLNESFPTGNRWIRRFGQQWPVGLRTHAGVDTGS